MAQNRVASLLPKSSLLLIPSLALPALLPQLLQARLIPLPNDPQRSFLLNLSHLVPVGDAAHRPVRVDDHWAQVVELDCCAALAHVYLCGCIARVGGDGGEGEWRFGIVVLGGGGSVGGLVFGFFFRGRRVVVVGIDCGRHFEGAG